MRSCVLLLLCALLSLGAQAENRDPVFATASLQALITEPRLPEISGLAKSRQHPDLLWAINDSGHSNELFALSTEGKLLASFRVLGARNYDWEDLALFELDGTWYLLIADFGDNRGVREHVVLYVVEEPDLPASGVGEVHPAWQIRYRYPDSPQDAESVAVDAGAGEVLVLNKRRVPATLYSLPLQAADDDELLVARPLGKTLQLPQPEPHDIDEDPRYGHLRSQPTAMDLSPDGRELVVLTYRWAWLYQRAEDEPDWSAAITRKPRRIDLPLLPQGEAIAYSGDGQRLWVTSEKLPAPLLKVVRLPVSDQNE